MKFVKHNQRDDAKYSVVKGLGYRMEESGTIDNYSRPKELLKIFEVQDDPGCRKVREALSILDLDAVIYPCPKDGPGWKDKDVDSNALNGLPSLVDPNSGMKFIGDADEIVEYLFRMYGNNKVPFMLGSNVVANTTAKMALSARKGRGATYGGNREPAPKPLEFWAYEGSPFCVVVKEVLSELAVPCIQRSCARGSSKRNILFKRRNHFQVPYIEDPNTGKAMFESAAIISYLRSTYGN